MLTLFFGELIVTWWDKPLTMIMESSYHSRKASANALISWKKLQHVFGQAHKSYKQIQMQLFGTRSDKA
jgi:hypothetical protein